MTHNDTLRKVYGTSTRACVDRIVAHYNAASDDTKLAGKSWYAGAGEIAEWLSRESEYAIDTCAAVIAHLSPRTNLRHNIQGAEQLLLNGERNRGIMGANYVRALSCLDSDRPLDTLNGQKTNAFAHNILGNTSRVCVDVWAVRAATGKRDAQDMLSRAGAYAAIEHAYVLAAARLGVEPSECQAVVWVQVRNGRSE